MPRLFLTPFVIAGLLFLPSCSSDNSGVQPLKPIVEPKPNQTEQAKSECDEVKETYDSYSKALRESGQGSNLYRLTYLIQQYYLLEKQECFTAEQIATAKASIDFVNNLSKP